MMGRCRLCRPDNDVELRRSHVISKAIYKLARSDVSGHEDPVVFRGGVAVQNSKQYWDWLLCSNCEQHVGESEAYAAPFMYPRQGISTLLRHVAGRTQWLKNQDGYAMGIAATSGLDVQLLSRFGTSLFWRAHEAGPDRGGTIRMRLNTAETLRDHIYTGAPLPEHVSLQLILMDPGTNAAERMLCSLAITATSDDPSDGTSTFRIIAHGLVFVLRDDHRGFMGDPKPRVALSNVPSHILVMQPSRVGIARNTISTHGRSTPKGKLAGTLGKA